MTQVHLATRFRIHSVFINNKPAQPFPPKLGISLCSLANYKPTPLPATNTPLCIHNLIFRTSFFSHFVFLRSVLRLLLTANVVAGSPILVILMMEALSSFETSVPTRGTRRYIPQDRILHTETCLFEVFSVV
jgi:hypothetical protein